MGVHKKYVHGHDRHTALGGAAVDELLRDGFELEAFGEGEECGQDPRCD